MKMKNQQNKTQRYTLLSLAIATVLYALPFSAFAADAAPSQETILFLNDGNDDLSFFSLGTYTADSNGNLRIVLTAGSEFTAVDAAAFVSPPEKKNDTNK